MRWISWLLLAAGLYGQKLEFLLLDPPVIEQRFSRLQQKNTDRADVLRTMFAEAGCRAERFVEQKVRGSRLPNLICVLPGSSERSIVITAHYDKVDLGEGAIDNWTGAALLPSLFQSVSAMPRTLTYVFLLTTDEEKGLVGARGYMRELKKEQRKLIVANVNIDCVGLAGQYSVWLARANQDLANAAAAVANSLGIPIKAVNFGAGIDSDSHIFVEQKIPVIDFHALTQGTLSLLHTSKDVKERVDMPTYYNTYRLLTAYLAYLDAREKAPPAAE